MGISDSEALLVCSQHTLEGLRSIASSRDPPKESHVAVEVLAAWP